MIIKNINQKDSTLKKGEKGLNPFSTIQSTKLK